MEKFNINHTIMKITPETRESFRIVTKNSYSQHELEKLLPNVFFGNNFFPQDTKANTFIIEYGVYGQHYTITVENQEDSPLDMDDADEMDVVDSYTELYTSDKGLEWLNAIIAQLEKM